MAMYDLEVKFSADSSQLKKAFKDTEKAAKDVEKSTNDVNEALGDDSAAGAFSAAMDEAASSAAGAVSETEQLSDALGNTAEQADSAGASVRRIAGAAAAIAVVRKAAAELLECFKAYADYESAVIRVNDIFKDAAGAVEDFAENNAAALGMSRSAAYEYAATYGNLFRSITADQEENSRVTIAMLSASAAIASKTGRTVSDVMERIRSGLLGNTEAIEDLGIFVNVAMLRTTDAFKRMSNGRSWEQLEYYEQQQIRTLAILEQAHKQFGGEISSSAALSVAAFQASVDDLKVSLGQLSAGALLPAIQVLSALARSALGCVVWFRSLDSTSKAYLKVALILGVAIPAVTLATKALALAQAGLHAVQALLIPQTLTYAAALKALLGWAALAAVAFGLLHALFSRNKDTESAADTMDDYNKSVEDTQKNANKAAGSIEDMTKATKDLTDEVQRSLASFDELNRLGDNNTNLIGIDNESIDKAAEALSAFEDLDYDINYDTNAESVSTRIKNALKNIWTETKKDYSDWTSWWEGLGEDMYTGIEEGNWEPFLSRLNEKVKILFGDEWADFWEKAGENMYTGIKDGDWTPLLEQFDGLIRMTFGDEWSDFWENVGDAMYEGIENGDWTPLLSTFNDEIGKIFGDKWTDYWEKVGEHMHKGIEDGDWELLLEDLDKGVRKLFGGRWSDFWYDRGDKMHDKLSYWIDKSSPVFDKLKTPLGKIKELFQDISDLLDKLSVTNAYDQISKKLDLPEMSTGTKLIVQMMSGNYGGAAKTGYNIFKGLIGHAEGAIVTKPEIAMIGENGAEAVIPLENNTGWIDMLAGKIAALIPSASGGDGYATIILDGREVGRFCIKAVEDNNRRKGS